MRLFLAIPIPKEPADGLVEALDRATFPKVRIQARHLWHITLVFLGDVPEVDVDLIKKTCEKFTTCPGTMTVDSLETFPSGGAHSLVGLGKESPRNVWKEFIENIRGEMLAFAPQLERRAWRPHVTVGKAVKGIVLERWRQPVGPWSWKPDGFQLVQSQPTEEGSQYRILHEFRFRV